MEEGPPQQSIVPRIVDEICQAKGVTQADLPPLYDAVDPDALDELLSTSQQHRDAEFIVTFTYGGYQVTVTDDGDVDLTDPPEQV